MIKINAIIYIVVHIMAFYFIYFMLVPQKGIDFFTKLSKLWGDLKYKDDNYTKESGGL